MRLIIDVLKDLIVRTKKDNDNYLHVITTNWAFQSYYDYHKTYDKLHISYYYQGMNILISFLTNDKFVIDNCLIIDSHDERYEIKCDIDYYLNMTEEIKSYLILQDESAILRKPFPFKEVI